MCEFWPLYNVIIPFETAWNGLNLDQGGNTSSKDLILTDELGGSIPPQAAKINNMKEDLKPVPMFADRETLKEAFDYATEVIDRSTTAEMSIYGTTAIAIIWNTLANKYDITKRK